MAFDSIKANTGVDDSFFDFSVPPGYTCVDHRFGEPIVAAPQELGQVVLDIATEIMDDVAAVQEEEPNVLGSDTETSVEERESDSRGGRSYAVFAAILAVVIAGAVIVLARRRA